MPNMLKWLGIVAVVIIGGVFATIYFAGGDGIQPPKDPPPIVGVTPAAPPVPQVPKEEEPKDSIAVRPPCPGCKPPKPQPKKPEDCFAPWLCD